ncbi:MULTISPECIES: hypothetical protein [Nostocaceae]|nr:MULTISPECIES: hypothetical protein [Nostocaceae]
MLSQRGYYGRSLIERSMTAPCHQLRIYEYYELITAASFWAGVA